MGAAVLEVLDGSALRRWCLASHSALTAARTEIDDLNVYPVPDGDTGTNLMLTLGAVVDALGASADDLPSVVRALTTGSLMGARGNSGVIVSQLLRGFGEVLGPLAAPGPADLVAALKAGAASAYTAVATPVEGTVLTVAREAAESAAGADLAAVIRSARVAAEQSLARTPDLLPQLKAAGVVDAGGRGWCVLLEALEAVITGDVVSAEPSLLVARDRSGLAAAREAGSEEFAYEVQFLLRETTEQAVAALKAALAALGDSLVVVGGDGLFNVHVHVNDVGAALEAGIEAGRPFRITVTRFEDQVSSGPPSGRAVVAVASGAGVAGLFRSAGATVVDGGPTANPSTAELLAAIRATGAGEVIVLPNDSNVRAVAAAAADQADVTVRVIATRSLVQGLAALSVADAGLDLADDLAAMTAAAEGTRWAEVTTAVRDSQTPVGTCREGDVLGLVGGAIAVIGDDLEQVCLALLDRLLTDGGEVVTVLLGEKAGRRDRLAAHLAAEHPQVEVQLLDGGQRHYPYLLGVE